MTFKIITTQPGIYDSFFKIGLIGRGIDKKIIDIKIFNLHDFAFDKHKSIDDTPYGGGAGMVMRVDVMANALSKIKLKFKKIKTILLTPQGCKFGQKDAKRLAKEKNLILISGRFEGYDERIRDLVDEEISIGDYVLTSGDLPAMVLIDTISRQIFIEKKESIIEESFSNGLIEYPQYTRPEKFKDKKVPEILLSGNHQKIIDWRKKESLKKTEKRRSSL
ncbi:MAG: tRNA (guanine-N(1)-)-methyltransferase [Berkelbacteria bacterium GW2011_GWB1_38_5]|uniref:tRNA (guanine-N(1)-)-methyltransferase n=1 Tax=Berkelbacteria bacterium GW2011_GWB1_38_5 TaxID=1618336 RepID=A0A0G0MK77_9BACT|nr:MAG: tRNA (guanine-N(1)-)-methyltransferase [Berkelbacteria bacterium GW2011_GWB1_38_5]